MSTASRRRLAQIVREPECDLAEAALLCCVEADPALDVEGQLLRIDALADRLRSTNRLPSGEAVHDARALGRFLADDLGFTGDTETYNDPRNGLLSEVLERRRGLPITLSILLLAIARRLRVPAYPIALPGHVVVGVIGEAGSDRPVVVDPFHDGRLVDEPELASRVRALTHGQLGFRRAMLRPTPAPALIRRVLNNLTRDFTSAGSQTDALWTVELKLLLPGSVPDDHRVLGELLVALGRFDEAADAYEAYVELVDGDAPDITEVSRQAIRARAKLN